jgi:predicted alpha/beta-hydrolase family hydrolase
VGSGLRRWQLLFANELDEHQKQARVLDSRSDSEVNMGTTAGKEIHFGVNEKAGAVSGLLLKPDNASVLLLLAHGAGAGMRHRFLEQAAVKLAEAGVATLRYQFPYMEKRIKRPDSEAVLTDTVRAACAAAKKIAGDLPVFAGGKSMGGRMTSLAAARQPLDGVRGLIFFGFPLHAAGRPGAERGEHLSDIDVPMLFLQGSRDALADLKLLKPLCSRLAKRAELFVVKGGDHSFHMLKSSGRSDDDALGEIVKKIANWIGKNG